MFRLYLSHLQALKSQTQTFIVIQLDYCKRWGSHNALIIHCMDLTLEGLKMSQVGRNM
jgi:hypothetical protein